VLLFPIVVMAELVPAIHIDVPPSVVQWAEGRGYPEQELA
jgi:hypothetical protein